MSSYRSTNSGGTVLGTGVDFNDWDKIETDADGKSVGLTAPVSFPEHSNELYTSGWSFGSIQNGQYTTYTVDGLHVPLEYVRDRLDSHAPELSLQVPTPFEPLNIIRIGNSFLVPTEVRAEYNPRWETEDEMWVITEVTNWTVFTLPQRESRNMQDFREAAQAVRDILNENGGDNACARFFEGAGLEALDALESVVNRQGEDTFRDLGNGALGIRMSIPTQAGVIGYNEAVVSDLSGNSTSIPGRAGFLTPSLVRINTRGPFVRGIPMSNISNDRLGRPGGYVPGSLQSRAVQLLHEVAHLLFRNRLTYQVQTSSSSSNSVTVLDRVIPLDGADHDPTGEESRRNTNRVMAACRAQIDRVRRQSR